MIARFSTFFLTMGGPEMRSDLKKEMAAGVGIIAVAVLLLRCAAADTYHVGDDMAWSVPPAGAAAYSVWAGENSFQLGDTLVFNWTGEHTVARVSKDVYDNCTTANVLANDTQSTSPVTYTLNSTEPQYFICTIGAHCSLGQKVTISVSSAPAPVHAVTTMFFLVMAISLLDFHSSVSLFT